jgi:hypothetical protein
VWGPQTACPKHPLCIQFMIPELLMNPHNRTGNQSTSSIQPNFK